MDKHRASFPFAALQAAFFLALALALCGCPAKQSIRPGKDEARQTGPDFGQRALNSAKSQIGRPYRLGGDSPQKGFDCSGLIYWAYKQHGIEVPRQTLAQAKAGRNVPLRQLKPGDIVVFRSPGAPNGLHTGIYAGNNEFVHSPNRRSRVRIESMEPYWRDQYLTGRRVTYGQTRRGARR